MTTNILGVPFTVFDNGLIAEDMTISIFCTNEHAQSFSFVNADLNNFSEFFDRYNCTSILFSTSKSPAIFDIEAIKNRQNIKKLGLCLEVPTSVLYTDSSEAFQNIEELSFSGIPPSNFPSLERIPKLRKLTIEYNEEFAKTWIGLKQVQDLHIISYSEPDFHILKDLSCLRRLKIEHGTMHSLNGIERLQNLETLIINGSTSLSDVNSILLSQNLKNIMFENYKKIKDWEFLRNKTNLQNIFIDTANSISFIKDLPNLNFFFCSKVLSRNKKSILFSTELHQDKMSPEGVHITYIPTCDIFYQPLDLI